MKCAEPIAGVDFTDAEEELALRLVTRNRDAYDAIRKVAVGDDVEPAIAFRPQMPAKRPAGHATPGAPLALARPAAVAVPQKLSDLAFLPLTALARLVETRKVTSTDLTKLYLDRLKRHDGRLECVVSLMEASALDRAAQVDREIAAGKYRGPLHGIPWGVKDLFATKGTRTTWGAKPYEHQVIDYDAAAVERLHRAGAVLIAKLTTGELAIGDVWFGGRTRNPWNPDRGASGSSAGPASAAAAGLVGFAVGTETGGSIISPSRTCGVTGLRPTYGRISRYGCMTLRWTMDKVGVIARGVEDAAIVLNALYGPDGRDLTVADVPFDYRPDPKLSGLRIGVLRDEFETLASDASEEERRAWPARRAVLADALQVFEASGARLEPITLPALPTSAIYAIVNAEAGAMFDDLVRSGRVAELTGKGPNDRANQLRASRFIPAVEYLRAQRVRTLLMQQMDDLMARYDAFISTADSGSVQLTNLTGHPAITMKAGFVDDLPVGVMVTGRNYDEATILRIALAFERATTWHTMHPRFFND